MDGQYSWKRTEELEIDLTDLLQKLWGQWKQIVACALVFAFILGGYGWLKERNGPDAAASDTAEEAVMEEMEENALTEEEEWAVADAIQLETETRGLEEYLNNSVLMQLDPYHKARYIMLYCVEHAERQELPKITESYLNFIANGGAADALQKSGSSWKMDKSCLTELISVYQKTYSYSSFYQTVLDSLADSSKIEVSCFYVEITGKDAESAKKMALDMQEVLEEYSVKVKEAAGSHRLVLVNSVENITTDTVLQAQQHEKKSLLSSNKTSLKAMKDAFNREQRAVYRNFAGDENEQEEQEEESLDVLKEEKNGYGIKYMLLGLVAGIFAYVCVFSCQYFFRDTIKSTEEMQRLYLFPVYGGILLQGRDRKNKRTMSGICQDAYGRTEAQVLNRIRLACQKQGLVRLCAASDFKLDISEKECLENMASQLKSWGIDMSVAENVSADIAAWDNLAEIANVLIVCRMGVTTHRIIDDTMSFYLENGIAVAGAIAFLQNT